MAAIDNVSHDEFNWREQPVHGDVGKAKTMGDVSGGKVYHGSNHDDIEVGDTIRPGVNKANFKQSNASSVSITSVPSNAEGWARMAGGDNAHVYEVEPLSTVDQHRVSPADMGASF